MSSLSSQQQRADQDRIASELKGNTLRVYWYVLNNTDKSIGVREVQRALKFSSPTLALYHLEKLRELGLVSKDSGEYRLVKEVKVDVLKVFVRVWRFFVPRFALYAVLFTVLTSYLVTQVVRLDFYSFFGLLLGSAATAIFWVETWKTWRQRP